MVASLTATQLESSIIHITWLPPFSFNLTTAEPDVVYCVEITSITNGTMIHLVGDCSVLQSGYIFTTYHEYTMMTQYYEVAVIPRSNVEGARNGSTATIRFGLLTGKARSKLFTIISMS